MKKPQFLYASILFLICGTAAYAAPMMRLTNAAINLPPTAAGTSPASTQLFITNAGDGTLAPTVTSGATWVQAAIGASVACPSGTTSSSGCLPLNLTFNTTALAPGSYATFLSVSDPNAVDSPQTISVSVSIVGGVPANIELYAAPSGGTASTTINLHSTTATLQASTATGGNWLTVSAAGNGSSNFYYPYTVKATSQTGQAAGDYNGSVQVTGSNVAADNATIPVLFHVTESPIIQLSQSAVALVAGQGGQASTTVGIANAGEGTPSITGATPTVTSGSGWLSATVASDSASVTITANAAGLQPGSYQGSVALQSNAANNAALVIPVTLVVSQQTGPLISFGGVVDNAVGKPLLSPGDIAAIYGAAFSSAAAANAASLPLPTTLGGVQVLVNGTAVPLYFTSTGQIDFQLPYEVQAGTAIVQVVNNGTPGNSVSVAVDARVPKILQFATAGSPPIIVNYADGSIPVVTSSSTPLPSHPAKPGDTLIIYAIGFGQTSPAATTGAGASGETLETVAPPVTVQLGGGFTPDVNITPSFAGLAPNFVGLYQVNVTIPTTFPTGVAGNNFLPLTVNVQGVSTLPVIIAIQ